MIYYEINYYFKRMIYKTHLQNKFFFNKKKKYIYILYLYKKDIYKNNKKYMHHYITL